MLERREPTKEFDEGIFKCLIDRVLVGEIDENGNANPYVLNFIFKSCEKIKCIGKMQLEKRNKMFFWWV